MYQKIWSLFRIQKSWYTQISNRFVKTFWIWISTKRFCSGQCCGSGMFIIPNPNLSIPDPGSKRFWIPEPHQRIYVVLTQKTVSKLLEKLYDMFFPEPEFSIPDPGSGGKKKRRIRNTGSGYPQHSVQGHGGDGERFDSRPGRHRDRPLPRHRQKRSVVYSMGLLSMASWFLLEQLSV